MKKFIKLILIGMMSFGLVGCAGENISKEEITAMSEENITMEKTDTEDEKIVVTDVRGKTIEFDAPPTRVATTGKPLPSMLYAVVGATDYLVGCNPSSMSAYEESILPYMYPQMANVDTEWCTKNYVVNVEELLKLEPEVVLCWASSTEEIEKMENAGIKVVAFNNASQENLEYVITTLGTLYQMENRAEELISYMHEQIADVTERLKDIEASEYPKVIHLYDDMNVAVDEYEHWMIPSCTNNLASELTNGPVDVDMEQMLIWNPDIIFIGNHTDLQPSELLENKQEGRDWSMITAVQNKQVYKVPIGVYRWDPAGIETPLMVKWVAKIQYPELFADMDMRQEITEYYKYVYQFDVTEEMLSEILDDSQN